MLHLFEITVSGHSKAWLFMFRNQESGIKSSEDWDNTLENIKHYAALLEI